MSAVIGNRNRAAANRERAPITGAFVESMRNTFGPVKVEFVSENGLTLGESPDYSGMYRVHAGEMALANCKPENKAK